MDFYVYVHLIQVDVYDLVFVFGNSVLFTEFLLYIYLYMLYIVYSGMCSNSVILKFENVIGGAY